MMEIVVLNIGNASVVFTVIGFLISLVQVKMNRGEVKLENLMTGAFAASTIPTGLILIICAFDQSLIQKLEGLNIYIAAAGLALLYLAYKTFRTE